MVRLDASQLCFLPALIRALKYPLSFGLRHSRQNSDHHFSHVTISTDPVIDKPDSHALGVECFNQLDHIGCVTAKTVELFHQNDVAFLHLHAQQIQSFPIG